VCKLCIRESTEQPAGHLERYKWHIKSVKRNCPQTRTEGYMRIQTAAFPVFTYLISNAAHLLQIQTYSQNRAVHTVNSLLNQQLISLHRV
jgi:hypothetical protein